MFGRKAAPQPYEIKIVVYVDGTAYPTSVWTVDPDTTSAAEAKRGIAAMLRSSALEIDAYNDEHPDQPAG